MMSIIIFFDLPLVKQVQVKILARAEKSAEALIALLFFFTPSQFTVFMHLSLLLFFFFFVLVYSVHIFTIHSLELISTIS